MKQSVADSFYSALETGNPSVAATVLREARAAGEVTHEEATDLLVEAELDYGYELDFKHDV